MHANTLPSDIWIVVLHYLSVEDLAHIAQASRYFHALVRLPRWLLYETLLIPSFLFSGQQIRLEGVQKGKSPPLLEPLEGFAAVEPLRPSPVS